MGTSMGHTDMYNYIEVDAENLEYVTVAEVGELGDGERLIVDIDDEPIAVFNIAGLYYAIADVCSHDDGPVAEGEVDEYEIACPRHGAKFDIRNGRVLTLPAIVDIPAYPVRIEGNEIQIGLPIES
ncbi:MAG: non-heme iron oxygenase ferredoxin subunit [Anaerolineales bacterium]|nr:non-heme iron oxygenase ferredoxin subunit [Anaerolineales bacterium]